MVAPKCDKRQAGCMADAVKRIAESLHATEWINLFDRDSAEIYLQALVEAGAELFDIEAYDNGYRQSGNLADERLKSELLLMDMQNPYQSHRVQYPEPTDAEIRSSLDDDEWHELVRVSEECGDTPYEIWRLNDAAIYDGHCREVTPEENQFLAERQFLPPVGF